MSYINYIVFGGDGVIVGVDYRLGLLRHMECPVCIGWRCMYMLVPVKG